MYSKQSVFIATYALDMFKSICAQIRTANEFPNPFEFTIEQKDEVTYTIRIVGNKTFGSDYDMNVWKQVPILECTMEYYSASHPSKANAEWLWLRLAFSPSWGSDYGTMEYVDNGFIAKRIGQAIRSAISDFTVQNQLQSI